MTKDFFILKIDNFFDFLVDNFSISDGVGFSKSIIFLYENLKNLFLFVNPLLFILTVCLLSFVFLKKRLIFLILPGFFFILYFNLWEASMDTIAIIFVSVLVSVILGIPIGILGGYFPRFYVFLKPILDLMQAMPPLFT